MKTLTEFELLNYIKRIDLDNPNCMQESALVLLSKYICLSYECKNIEPSFFKIHYAYYVSF